MCIAIKYYMYSVFLGKKRKRNMWSVPKKRKQKKRLPKGKMTVEEAGGWRQLILWVKVWEGELYSKCNVKPLTDLISE